jgi:hypothetical protein
MHSEVIGVGSGSCVVRDVQEALTYLDGSIQRVRKRFCTPTQAEALGRDYEVLRAHLVAEAEAVTNRGERWSVTVGDLCTSLTPSGWTRHR